MPGPSQGACEDGLAHGKRGATLTTPTPPDGEPPVPGPGSQPGDSGSPQPPYGQYGQSGPPRSQDAQQPGGWGSAPELPSYGAPGGPQAYGQYGPPTAGPVFAASQPGIIPLRPLTMGEMYDGAFKAIRANPAVMFGLAAIVVAAVTIIQTVLTWSLYEDLNSFVGQADPTAQDVEDLYSALGATIVPNLASAVVSFLATTVLNGVLIHSVSQSVIGRTLALGELWKLIKPQLARLLLLTLVIGVAAVVVVGICLVPGILGALSGDLGTAVGLLLLGMVLALAALVFIVVATVLATPVLVLERAGVWAALRRSWQLTRPMFWRVLGIYLLTSILVGIVSAIVAAPFGMIGGLIGGIMGTTLAQIVGGTAAAAITTPFMAAVIALLYIDIRIRTEGLDVELAAAAAENG